MPLQSEARKLLLSYSTYEKKLIRNEVRANLQNLKYLYPEEQNRAAYVMQSKALQSWLQEPDSSALLINGHCASVNLRSPLSFVCAKLWKALYHARKYGSATLESIIIDLHFFCGEHSSSGESLYHTPDRVLQNLLAQFLLQYKGFDLSLIKGIKKLDSVDMTTLGRILGKLLAQLPSKTMVFCLVDTLEHYSNM